MLEMNIKYSGHNSVLLPFWANFFKMPLLSGDRYFWDLIGGQKINVTFGFFRGAVTFGILRYYYGILHLSIGNIYTDLLFHLILKLDPFSIMSDTRLKKANLLNSPFHNFFCKVP